MDFAMPQFVISKVKNGSRPKTVIRSKLTIAKS